MADIINLRQARKAKGRAEKAQHAEQNRAKFGRTKAEKARDEKTTAHAKRHLDQAKIGRDD